MGDDGGGCSGCGGNDVVDMICWFFPTILLDLVSGRGIVGGCGVELMVVF